MNKQIIVPVFSQSDNIMHSHLVFAVTIDAALAARIKQLSAALNELGVRAIEEDNFNGVWSNADLCSSEFEPATQYNDLMDKLADDCMEVDFPTIRITADGFCFWATPKHSDESEAFDTAYILVSELDNNDPLMLLS